MRMTLIWDTGSVAQLYHDYIGGSHSDRFILEGSRSIGAIGGGIPPGIKFLEGDSVTFECIGNVIYDSTCDLADGSGISTNIVYMDSVTDKKVGMAVSGPGIAHDAYIGSKHTVVAGGARSGTDGTVGALDATFTASSGAFTSDDIGREITVTLGGMDLDTLQAIDLVTRIASINGSTSVELENAAAQNIAGSAAWAISAGRNYVKLYAGGGTGYGTRYHTGPASTDVKLKFQDRYWQELSRSVDPSRMTTLAALAAPSVHHGTMYITQGSTTITSLLNGWVGHTVTIMAHGAIEIHENVLPDPLSIAGNFAMTQGDTITLTCFETDKWCEISRSDNG
jgi:hypothetical protein